MSNAGRPRRFRLERVLDHRRRLTEEAQLELATRARERAEVESTLEGLQRERDALAGYLEEQLHNGGVDIDTLVAAEAYDFSLRLHTSYTEQLHAEAVAKEAEALDVLLDRRLDQKVLEKLRDRARQQAIEQELAAEQRLLDEVATIRHATGTGLMGPGRMNGAS